MLALTVNTLDDIQDGSVLDGSVSLRDALAFAGAYGGQVDFQPSLAGGTIRLSSTLDVSSAATIIGLGADKLTISGGGAVRVFNVANGASQIAVGISGVTIADGYCADYSGDGNGGGGIYSTEDLTLDSVVLRNNQGGPKGGGLSQKGGSLNVVNSTFSTNKARYGGGAIIDSTTTASITGSSFVYNVAYDTPGDANDGGGGGLYLASIAQANPAQIKNTTISSNVAERAVGGLILANSYATVINSTVTLNETAIEYSGLAIYGGGLTLNNSIVAGNVGATPDALTGGLSGGNNLFAANFTGLAGLGVKLPQGQTVQLSPLGLYGGSTPTHVPLPGSLAVDAGSDAAISGLTTDQRGFRRQSDRPLGTALVDIGAAELSSDWGLVNEQFGGADFNGDGRRDQLLLDPTTHRLSVLASSTLVGGVDPQFWGSVPAAVGTAGTSITAGDFDGDGRDDLLIRVNATYHVAISDGNSFIVHENVGSAGASSWDDIYAGDLNGDGTDEFLAWSTTAAGWQAARYSPQTQGLLNDGTWAGNLFRETGATRFLADANRDGRADLIRRTSGGQWAVALSQPLTASAASGTLVNQSGWSTNWFNSYYADGALNADGPIQAIIDVFESVYNTVELELYPGLMKGPDATEQTKAGNDWDQAALLERELTAIGVPAWIVTGTVTVPAATVVEWLGILNPNPINAAIAATNLLRATLDAGADISQSGDVITFQHAWVRVQTPTANGLQTIDLDPSWKFKDRQVGIPNIEGVNFIDVNGALPQPDTGMFDEFEYLTLNPSTDKRLPLEFYEDQLMGYLAANHPGMSVADVAYDGPILTKSFATIPAGAAGGVSSSDSRQFDSLSTLLAAGVDSDGKTPREKYTHRVKIRLMEGEDAHWSDELVVSSHSLDAINITFASSFANAANANSIAAAGSSQFFGRLTVGGTVRQTPVNSSMFFGSSDTAVLEVTHYSPTKLSLPDSENPAGPSANDRKLTFNEKPGEIIAFAMDANQHSEHSLVDLKADILSAVANDTTEAALLQDVDDLTAYAGAKYWYDFNRSNEAVARGTRSISGQQWVGSGIVKADPVLLADPAPEGSNDVVIEFLPYGMAPQNFGVDLPNSNHFVGHLDTGLLHEEAWQLLGYNSSALEHTIVEEVISSPSISTIKGLQRAAQTNLGFTGSGTLDTGDSILVFKAIRSLGTNDWTLSYNYNWRVLSDGLPRINGTGAGTITSESQLTNSTDGLLRHHTSTTNLGHTLWQFFGSLATNPDLEDNESVNEVTVLVPSRRTNLYDSSTGETTSQYVQNPNGWVGGVYITEIPGVSAGYIINEHGPSSGGYSGNKATAPPIQLKPGTFSNFTSAGDPVNVGNGNMYRDETDIVFPNLGVPLTFSRHYDAQSKDDFGLGAGWMHSFGDLIYTEANGDRVWLDSGGQRHVFRVSGASFAVPDSLRGDISYTSGVAAGSVDFVFKSRDGMEYRFEKVSLTQSGKTVVGRLNSIVDRNNDGVVVEYQAGTTHRTIKHVRDTHSSGVTPDRRLAFVYDNDVIDSVSKHAGGLQGTWDFSYIDMSVAGFPSTKRLSASLAPAVAVLDGAYTQTTSRPTVSYYYVGPSDPYLGRGLIQQITEADGAWHGYEYYANGRVFRVRQGNPGEPVSTPNPEVQSFTYNLYRNLTEFTDERGNVETYIHQDNGQLKTQIHPDRTRLSYVWGAMGSPDEFRLASTTDERGAVESFTYYGASDPAFKRGQLKTSTTKKFPAAAAITTVYDYFNPTNKPHIAALASVVVDSTAAADDAPNNVQYAGKQLVTTYAYDGDGRRTLTTDPLGNQVVETYYDTSDYRDGLLKSVIDGRRQAGADWEDGDDSAVAWRILGNHNVAADGGALVVETSLFGHNGDVSLDAVRIDRLDASGNVVETHIVDDDIAGRSAGFTLVGVTNASVQAGNLHTPRYANDATSVPYTGQSAGSLARWEFKDLKAGNYRISTTWIEWNNTPGRSSSVGYQVVGGGQPFVVDQRLAPDTGTFGVHWFDEFETTFEYDPAGNVTNTKTSDGYSSGLSTYNAFGQVIHSADPTGVFTEAVYDALGRLRETGYGDSNAATINPIDHLTSAFKYDAVGRVRESIDPLGRVTKFEYDGRGRLLKQINADATIATHEYDDLGNCISRTDELGRTTRFVYDVRNRLIQTIHPDGAIERTRYDGIGNVVASLDALGSASTFKYDAVGRLTETKLPDPVTGTTTASSPTTTNKYDKLGHLVETVDPELNVSQFKYDKLGRVIQSQTLAGVNGSRTLTSFATVGTLLSLTTTDYDANGNVRRSAMFDTSQYDATETDALEANPRAEITAANVAANFVHVMSTAYDAFNRARDVVSADGTSVRLVYDAAGRTRRTMDELGRITTQTYDALGRLASTTLPDPDGAAPTLSSPVTRYSYDAAGNQTAITDARGYVTHFQYDASDRLAATTDALGGRSTTTYNAVGQAVIVTNALGHAAFTRYDKRGRAVLTRAADPDGTGHNLAPTTRRTYDAAGRLETEIDPRGTMKSFAYDKIGRLRFEHTTLTEIVDDGDPGFSKHHANDVVGAPPSGSEVGYGGDWRLITTSGGYAAGVWTFENLPAGTYRIATTWTPNLAHHDYLSLQASVDGNSPYYPSGVTSLAQRTGPNSEVRYDEGFARWWKSIPNTVSIAQSDANGDGVNDLHTLAIILVPGTAPLAADAVRIERVITREYAYDANGNRLKEIDPIGSATTDATDRVTTYTYDELGRATRIDYGAPKVAGPQGSPPNYTQLLAQSTTNAYDGYGNLVRVVDSRATNSSQQATETAFDRRNRPILTTRDAGIDGTDFNGNPAPTLDFKNDRTAYVYDAVGNVTETSEIAETSSGPLTVLRRTTRKYDALDRLVKETFNDENDPTTTADDADDSVDSINERVTVNEYDATGHLLRVQRNPLGNSQQIVASSAYDALGRVISSSQSANFGTTQVRTSRTLYDAIGRVVGDIDPLGRISRNEFDKLGRLTKAINPDPDGSGSQLAVATTFTYDAGGNLLTATNGAGETDRHEYDSLSRRVRTTDGRGDRTTRRYDDVGNLLRLVDPAGNRTDSVYDAFDRLASETTYDGVTPQARTLIYDNNGNVAISVDRNGRATRRYYDRLDRVLEERWYASETLARAQDGSYSGAVYFVYDAFGRLEERRLAHRVPAVVDRVTDSYVYDGLDRIVEHSNLSHFGSTLDSLDALGVPSTPVKQTYVYAYNGSYTTTQRRQWVGVVNHTVTTTGVGPFGETNYVVDGDAQYGAGLEFEGTSTTYAYDKSGALTSTTRETDWDNALGWQNQTQTVYGYDGAGRLASLDHSARRRTTTTWPAYSALVGFDYLYDPADRMLGVATVWNTSQPGLTTRPSSEAAAFTYDDAGQLTGVDSSVAGDDAGYTILANGQRYSSTEEGAAKLYAHGVQNRLTSDATYTYVYDAEGNLTERKFVSGGATDQTYSWDHKNRLTRVENYANNQVSETIDYRYDAAGGLVRRSVTPVGGAATREHYALEGGRRALTLDAAGNVTRRHSYAPSREVLVDQAFATTGAETQLTTPLSDHQGSPRILYGGLHDVAPTVRQSVDYAPFGRITEIRDAAGQVTTADLDAAFGHHGSLQDQKTGLQLKGARWYSPDLGRFVSVDPIQDGTNWYEFAGNDPVNQSDPTGLKAIWSDPRNSLSAPSYKLQSTSFDTSLRTSVPRAPSSTQQIGLASTAYTPYSPPPAARRTTGRAISGPLPRHDNFVRSIGTTTIVPRAAADLPGVAPLLREPSRYVAANHNDQGHMVLNIQQGGVRYVTGNDYLSIHEQSRRAGHQGQAAAWQAEFADIAGEALISISPFHDTRRDVQIAAGYGDYYNPNDRLDGDDQARAATFLMVPGGNSGEARKAQRLIDAVNVDRVQVHHLMTNKNSISTAAGGPFTPKFEILVEQRGITLQDAANKVKLSGHVGPHPAYNAEVYRILDEATQGLKGAKFNRAFDRALDHVRTETLMPGTTLNRLGTGQRGAK